MVVSPVLNDPSPKPTYRVCLQAFATLITCNAIINKALRGALVDRGANGGILGKDAMVLHRYDGREVNIKGINNHEMSDLTIVDGASKCESNRGPVILIMNQYAYHPTGGTIHSCGQIEHYKNVVDDRSMKVGGKQCIKTLDGYILPLDIINGLPYLKMEPPSQKELDELPHVILTPGDKWDPTVLDNTISDQEDWVNNLKDIDEGIIETPFDMFGNYRYREPTEYYDNTPSAADVSEFEAMYHLASNLNAQYIFNAAESKPKPIDYNKYRAHFLHAPVEKIRRTFQNTTQYATNVMSGRNIMQTIKSPFPAHNVWRRHEPVASDTVFSDTPAVCTNGQTMAQIFVGRKSLVIDVYGIGNTKEFVNTLEDVIRKRGAMDLLVTDSARVETSRRVADILRALCIDDWQSEAHYQHQNFAEHRWRHLKGNHQWWMNHRNVAPNAWLLCLQWCADVMNHISEKSLGWRTPLQVLTGQTTDISILLVFLFWDVVYVPRYKDKDYSGNLGTDKSSEIRGRFVGFSWDVGHALTFKILTDDTQKIICRSRVRIANDDENNLKLDLLAGDVKERVYIRSKRDDKDDVTLPTIDLTSDPFTVDETVDAQQQDKSETDNDSDPLPMDLPLKDRPTVETVDEDDDLPDHLRSRRKPGDPNPDDEPRPFLRNELRTENPTLASQLPPEELVGRTFLMPPEEDGSRFRAKIIEEVNRNKDEGDQDPEMIKFRAVVNNDYEEIVAYNDIVDFIEQDQTWDGVWKFREILDHQGPLKPSDKRYKGSSYNLQVEWETGEITWEPLSTKRKDGVYDSDPVTVAIYADKHKLLNTAGWKLPGLKKRAKTQKRLIRAANQAKLHSYHTSPIYMYGFQVPRDHRQAMQLDAKNKNTMWRDAEELELSQQDEYNTFVDKGPNYKPTPDYKKIRVHFVYAVKHDGRHKARLVAGGHLTDTPVDSVYSSVVSLRGIRILTFLAELNGLEFWSTDIGNAYLESYTKEKVYIIAGPEFGEREGHVLLISRALYGLKSSGLRWHERLADVLRSMGFFPSRAENDIWMRDKGDHYEYVAVYVDDLAIASKAPKSITDCLMQEHKFKLKGTGPIAFHLGCDFYRDKDGVQCYAPLKYIQKIIDNYTRIFGQRPRQVLTPLVKGDHPELDTSELLGTDDIKIYQSLIGCLQWAVQIGRFDIATATMTMSRFRAAPRQGHMDRVKRIHGYLSKMRYGVIRMRVELPDFSSIPEKHYDWEYTCYHGAKEVIPKDVPKPKGKIVRLSSYKDANLYHDLISGRAVTGILHLANKTPIDWYSKLQSTVETATFGSEYSAGRTCTDQAIDLRLTFRYLGVPIDGAHFMFGDNETVVNTASMPHGKLHKRHNALAYHRVREAIAAGIIRFHHIPGHTNPADILSKHWDYPSVWPQLRPLLFYHGDTAELVQESKVEEASNAKEQVGEADKSHN